MKRVFVLLILIVSALNLYSTDINSQELILETVVPENYGIHVPDEALSLDQFLFEFSTEVGTNELLTDSHFSIGNFDDVSMLSFTLIYYGNLSRDYNVIVKANSQNGFVNTNGDSDVSIPVTISYSEPEEKPDDIKITDEDINNMLNKYSLNAKTLAIKLSGGEQKKLAIMIATMQNPDLLIFDEPTASLDPRERYNVKNMIKEFAQNDKTILFTSHDLEEVEDIADRIVFLYKGEILESGSKDELLSKYNFDSLEKLYLHITNY